MNNSRTATTPGVTNSTRTAVYGITQPTADDLRATIDKVYGRANEGLWTRLLTRAGVNGTEGNASAARLIGAARDSDDEVLAMCGRAQHIRMVTHERLATVRDTIAAAR